MSTGVLASNFFGEISQMGRSRFHFAGPLRRSRWSMAEGRVSAVDGPDGRAAAAGRGTRGLCSIDPICQSEVETYYACGRAVWRALSSPYVDDILRGECAIKHVIERTSKNLPVTIMPPTRGPLLQWLTLICGR